MSFMCFWKKCSNTNRRVNNKELDDEDKPTYAPSAGDKKKELSKKYGDDVWHVAKLNENDLQIEELKHLGYGAFSVVKKAFSKKYDCDVAIKIIACNVNDEQSYKYWRKILPIELKLWKELSSQNHENVIMLKEHIQFSAYQYLIGELADRGDLSMLLMRGCVTELKGKQIFKNIVAAVTHCHGLGIAHRDIKPENLMLGKGDTVKLADFTFVTKENPCRSAYGTPNMLAPEQCERGGEYSPFISDIWQMAITLYMMLFKMHPYRCMKRRDIEYEITEFKSHHEGVQYPSNKKVSTDLKDLIGGMLRLEPSERWTLRDISACAWLKEIQIREVREVVTEPDEDIESLTSDETRDD